MFKKTLGGLVLLVGLVAASGYWLHLQLNQTLHLTNEQVLEVTAGRSYSSLLKQLEQEGLISSSLASRLWLRIQPQHGLIRAGEYRLDTGITLSQLHKKMQHGKVINYKITFIEGSTFQDMRNSLAAANKLQQTTRDWSEAQLMAELGLPNQAAEGMFFPSTYTYTKGMQDLDLLRQANTTLVQILEKAWAERSNNLPYKNSYEALIMASIVERETGAAYERPDIAGVFVRRLQQGMRLQTDPTVIYGMQDHYKGRITRKDLQTPTPWNTYTIYGLPPTPIALPSAEAIKASLNPAAGTSLYFVAKGDGTHQFSNSLAEHNKAVKKYQLQRRSDYRSSPAPQPPVQSTTQPND